MHDPINGPKPAASYGCWGRYAIITFGAKLCQYTHTALGHADPRCAGCNERFDKQLAKR